MSTPMITIVHYPNTIPDDFTDDLLSGYDGPTLHFNQVVVDTSKPQASWQEMVLHAYVVLGAGFWSAYLSGTLSTATVEILKSALNKMGRAVQGKKFKYLQSDGVKETRINYGFKVHPKKGYSIEFHAEGDVTADILEQALKHVERVCASQEPHLFEIHEIKGKSLKKKR